VGWRNALYLWKLVRQVLERLLVSRCMQAKCMSKEDEATHEVSVEFRVLEA
jgi:hypothetical protein